MEHSDLWCGAAVRDITPKKEELQGLRALQDREFGGILDDIHVRVLMLTDHAESGKSLLFVVFEMDKAPYPLRYIDMLSARTGVDKDSIFVLAVHTHTAPICGDRTDDGPNNILPKPAYVKDTTHAYERRIERLVLEAAQEACRNLRPVKLCYGLGESFINVHRNVCYLVEEPDGGRKRKLALGTDPVTPVSHDLQVLSLIGEDGQPAAFFVNYPVHCCVLHMNRCCDGKVGISPDIAGSVSGWLEEQYPGSVAVWTSGAAGDINPLLMTELDYPDPVTGDQKQEALPGDTRGLLKVMAGMHEQDIRRLLGRMEKEGVPVRNNPIASTAEWVRIPGTDEDYEVRLHMARIGDIVFLGASGELYGRYDAIARELLPGKRVIVLNHDASLAANSGYILDDRTRKLEDADLADVPGFAHTHMGEEGFEAAFRAHVLHMKKRLFPEEGTDAQGPSDDSLR